MKQRTISAVIALALFIPICIYGGLAFNIAFYVLTLLGLNEFMQARSSERKIPDFIRLIMYILITLMYLSITYNSNSDAFSIDYRVISGIFLTIFIPVIFYHDESKYNIKDAFYLLGGLLFLGFSLSMFNFYRAMGLEIIIFLFLITIITDSYAYFIGRLIGKNKLIESISPNKTWEGTIGGSLVCTFVCTVYYLTVVNPQASVFLVSILVLFLSIVGQFGDLFFSAIKRTYKIKDFSNIMPGHGGILDRFDSIIFVMLLYTFFIGLL